MIPTYRPYVGERAARYEQDRISTQQWQREHAAVSLLLSRSTGSVLDIPVGTGRFGDVCKTLKRGLLGMDVSEDMMEQARAKGIECRYGSALEIPLPGKSVSTIVCLRLLNWFEEDEVQVALSEFRRVAAVDIILNLAAIQGSEHVLPKFKRVESKQILGHHYVLRILV